MKKRIFNFKQFLLEQEATTNSTGSTINTETDREAKSRIAKGILKNLFGDELGIGGGIDSDIEITKEVEGGLPYKGCGATEGYPLKKISITLRGFKEILESLKDTTTYTRSLAELDEKRALIIGIRNRLSVKKETANQDRFIDALYFIPQNAEDEDIFTPYQITTVPSLAYYGNKPLNPKGVGIKLPGETLYYLKEATLGKSKYKMMVEGEPIEAGRYKEGVVKFETYHPVDKFEKQNCGMQIHKSSATRGVCVGPWSAGCQVFADGTEWNEFIALAEKQTTNSNKFIYALIELDLVNDETLKNALRTKAEVAKDTTTGKTKEIDGEATFEEDDYTTMADSIYKAMKGVGTDEEVIYNTLENLKNKADWKKLVAAFDKKDEMTLVEWIKDDMSDSEIEKVNTILKAIGATI